MGEEGEGTAIYCDMAIGRVCGGINEVVTMEADGVFGDLHHRAFPCDIGSEGR